jgi:type I restriction enzyme S subunit
MSDRLQRLIDAERTVGAQPKLAIYRIKSLPIGLPPTREEQVAIAAVLDDADRLLSDIARLTEKKRRLMTGIAQRLVTGREHLPGYEGDWETVSIDDAATRFTGAWGSGQPTSTHRHAVEIVGVGDISRDGSLVGSTRRYLTDRERANALSKQGDVLFAGSGEPGKVWFNDGSRRVGAANFLRRLEPIPGRTDGRFLYYALRSHLAHVTLAGSTAASVIANVQAAFFRQKWLPLPPLPEQEAIAGMLQDMDTDIRALEQRLVKATDLRHAMAQQLLSGKVRLANRVAA